jgi:hypothetical protein
MKILFITTDENKNLHCADRAQGDYIENTILLGLRKLLGKNCVDYPRKRILYHDWSSVSRNSLHGRGFSLYHESMEDIPEKCRNLDTQTFDVILYGTAYAWNMTDIPELETKAKIKFYIDGHDLYGHATNGRYIDFRGERLIGNQISPSFKGQIIEEESHVYPTGVGLPESRMLEIDFSRKNQLIQKAYPRHAFFEPAYEVNRSHYLFTDENKYYEDMANSWFGLTCKRGGYDAMRHYEIIAAGAVLLYRDYNLKPKLCSPGDLPAMNYNSKEELIDIMNSLVVNNKPTGEYIHILNTQRKWLIDNATTVARANYILETLKKYV